MNELFAFCFFVAFFLTLVYAVYRIVIFILNKGVMTGKFDSPKIITSDGRMFTQDGKEIVGEELFYSSVPFYFYGEPGTEHMAEKFPLPEEQRKEFERLQAMQPYGNDSTESEAHSSFESETPLNDPAPLSRDELEKEVPVKQLKRMSRQTNG